MVKCHAHMVAAAMGSTSQQCLRQHLGRGGGIKSDYTPNIATEINADPLNQGYVIPNSDNAAGGMCVGARTCHEMQPQLRADWT